MAILISAVAGFALLIIGFLVVSSLGVEADDPVARAPRQCVDSWNADRLMVAAGKHNSSVHGYSRVEVARLAPDGEEPSAGGPASCVVVFARRELDPEPYAAAYVNRDGGWSALSQFADEQRLATLQAEALVRANARLKSDGTLRAASEG